MNDQTWQLPFAGVSTLFPERVHGRRTHNSAKIIRESSLGFKHAELHGCYMDAALGCLLSFLQRLFLLRLWYGSIRERRRLAIVKLTVIGVTNMCVNIKTRRYTSDTSLPGEEFWQDCRSQKTANRNPDCFSSYRRNFYLPSFGCGSLARNSPQHRWFVLRQETLAATWSAATLALRMPHDAQWG